MADLIDRQMAVKAADVIIQRDTSGNNDVVEAMKAWKVYIEALPSAQPDKMVLRVNHELSSEECARLVKDVQDQPIILIADTAFSQQWTPMSERLPEEGQAILATTTDNAWGDVVVVRKFDKEMYKSVIAWQRLPAPWKGET